MSDELKSAWEIALEKMEAEGGQAIQKLTPEQKEEIAEIRRIYQARVAEREIGLQAEIRKAAQEGEFERVEGLRRQLAEEKQALQAQCEEKIQKVKEPE